MDDLLTLRDVAAILDCSETSAFRWARKHRLDRIGPRRMMRRTDVVRLKANPAAQIERKSYYEKQLPPPNAQDFITLGTVRQMLCPEKPPAYETVHRILDRAGIVVLRISRCLRFVRRSDVENYLASCVEKPGTVALSRHDRVARRPRSTPRPR